MRLANEDVSDLYSQVNVGKLRPPSATLAPPERAL
jgi:hypothetical protein